MLDSEDQRDHRLPPKFQRPLSPTTQTVQRSVLKTASAEIRPKRIIGPPDKKSGLLPKANFGTLAVVEDDTELLIRVFSHHLVANNRSVFFFCLCNDL